MCKILTDLSQSWQIVTNSKAWGVFIWLISLICYCCIWYQLENIVLIIFPLSGFQYQLLCALCKTDHFLRFNELKILLLFKNFLFLHSKIRTQHAALSLERNITCKYRYPDQYQCSCLVPNFMFKWSCSADENHYVNI